MSEQVPYANYQYLAMALSGYAAIDEVGPGALVEQCR
jgi:hypothetical protein